MHSLDRAHTIRRQCLGEPMVAERSEVCFVSCWLDQIPQLQSSAFFRGRPTSTQLQWPGRPNKAGVAGQDTVNDRCDDTHDLNTFCRKQSTAN